jgi:hypothetical protein
MNLCRACGEDFASVNLFDRHRVGVHAYSLPEGLRMEPPREDGRRCLTAAEMRDRGWVRNGRGGWTDPAKHPGARLRPRHQRTETVPAVEPEPLHLFASVRVDA